jgi:antitoxin MazE
MNATTKTQLARWGNSLAVRIPLRVVEMARLREGEKLMLAVGKNGPIVIKPTQRRYQLDELISKSPPGTATTRPTGVREWARKLGDPSVALQGGESQLPTTAELRSAPAGRLGLKKR